MTGVGGDTNVIGVAGMGIADGGNGVRAGVSALREGGVLGGVATLNIGCGTTEGNVAIGVGNVEGTGSADIPVGLKGTNVDTRGGLEGSVGGFGEDKTAGVTLLFGIRTVAGGCPGSLVRLAPGGETTDS